MWIFFSSLDEAKLDVFLLFPIIFGKQGSGLLVAPHTRLKGDRAFETVAPRLWNALPLDLRAAASVDIFEKQLKTYLYRQAFPDSL